MSAGCFAKKTKDKKTIKSSDKSPSTITCYIKYPRWGDINNTKPLLKQSVSLGLLFIEGKLEELHPLSVKQRSNSTLPFNGAQLPSSDDVYRKKHKPVLFSKASIIVRVHIQYTVWTRDVWKILLWFQNTSVMSLRGGGQGRDGEEVNGFGAWLGGVDLGGGWQESCRCLFGVPVGMSWIYCFSCHNVS